VGTLMIRYVRCGYLPSVLNALLILPDSKTHSHKTTLIIPERRAKTSKCRTHNHKHL
jgi:hypothetical protein